MTYFVRIAGGVDLDAPPLETYNEAMSHALTIDPDEIITIERTTPRPGLRVMVARYLPTGPGRGWDFAMIDPAPR